MKTKEEILDCKFKECGIRKGWIEESRKAVLDAMEEYAHEKLRLSFEIIADRLLRDLGAELTIISKEELIKIISNSQ